MAKIQAKIEKARLNSQQAMKSRVVRVQQRRSKPVKESEQDQPFKEAFKAKTKEDKGLKLPPIEKPFKNEKFEFFRDINTFKEIQVTPPLLESLDSELKSKNEFVSVSDPRISSEFLVGNPLKIYDESNRRLDDFLATMGISNTVKKAFPKDVFGNKINR